MTIPKTIWQISKNKYEDSPDYIKPLMDSWKNNNPDWEYRHFDDQEGGDFLKENFGSKYEEIYNKITIPFCRSDFWRYLVLQKFGGVYADIDTICITPIEKWIDLSSDIALTQANYSAFPRTIYEQWIFGATQNSKLLKNVVNKVLNNLETMLDVSKSTAQQTGPLVWTEAIDEAKTGEEKFCFFNLRNSENSFNLYHYVGNSSWSDQTYTKKLSDYTYWSEQSDLDLKIYGSGYDSQGNAKWL